MTKEISIWESEVLAQQELPKSPTEQLNPNTTSSPAEQKINISNGTSNGEHASCMATPEKTKKQKVAVHFSN